MITFTIITCTYNASSVIDRTLSSVLSQDYPNVEHVIVDGNSSDDTVEKVMAYADASLVRHPSRCVTVKSERDKGLYDAMNKGISRAKGDYLVFLNAGDVLYEAGTLSLIAGQIDAEKPLPGVVYGNTAIVDEGGKFLGMRRLAPPERLTWRSFRHGMLVCHQSFYALTSIAKQTPYDLTYRLSADVDWCIRVMKQAEKEQRSLHNTHLTLCSYLDGGMSVQNHRASLIERFHIMRKHYGLVVTLFMHAWFVIRQNVMRF